MDLSFLNRAACYGAAHYRSFMRANPAVHKFLDTIEDESNSLAVRKTVATQLWTSIELEHHQRGVSPTLAALSSVKTLPSFRGLPALDAKPTRPTYWFAVLRVVVIFNRKMRC